ncbi:MAG: SAM-dependent methyltransferase [Burkholderiaceae bacterium]
MGFSQPKDTWNARFDRDDYLFGKEPNAFLRREAKRLNVGRTLCVADGEGRNSVYLSRLGHQVEAFDLADLGVQKAEQLAQDHGVQVNYLTCGWEDYPWPAEGFDNIVAIFIQFADPTARTRLFAHMEQSLKPGGRLLLQGYTPKQLEYKTGGPPHLDHLYTPALIERAFPSLSTELLQEYEDEIHEGTGHHGKSALLGYVGVKPRTLP